MSENRLPERLKELRTVNNYTQDYVAGVLGVVRQTYSYYETGKRTPNTEILYKLASLYGITLDDLMHLSTELDENIFFDQPNTSQSSDTIADYLEYFSNPMNKKKYQYHSNIEKELLYYFNKISEDDKKEIIEFTKIKAKRKRQGAKSE